MAVSVSGLDPCSTVAWTANLTRARVPGVDQRPMSGPGTARAQYDWTRGRCRPRSTVPGGCAGSSG